jgi:FAD:protein FMN transferase
MTSTTYAATRWQALGSYVSLVVADADRLATAQAACEQLLDEIDRACSRFRDDSDLVRANHGAGRWVRVSALLIQALTEAVRVAEATDGLVDPTLGSHLVALGYDRDLAQVQALDSVQPRVPGSGFGTGTLPAGTPVAPDGWRRIDIDPEHAAVRVPAGVALDLGATGKAFAADLIAATVPELTGTSLIISLGGDVAIGTLDSDIAAGVSHPWRVSVAERPQDAEGEQAQPVVLQSGGLATSSTLARRWRLAGASVHHLLDPRTGLPVDPVWRRHLPGGQRGQHGGHRAGGPGGRLAGRA